MGSITLSLKINRLNYDIIVFSKMLQDLAAVDLDFKVQKATEIIRKFNGAVVALSAGVDSSLVALLAHRALGERAVAATAASESLPPGELEVATKTAEGIGIKHFIIRTRELDNPNYASNPSDRCYYCKDTLYHELRILADNLGCEVILDGTQVDDLGDDRPGLRAAMEAGVSSPLVEAGFSKGDVRRAAKAMGLSIWDKPAMPCLSSRIPHGLEVTEQKLWAIGQAELYVKQLTGVTDLRVRHHGSVARLEVSPEDRHMFSDERLMNQIGAKLRVLGFSELVLGLRNSNKNRGNNPGPEGFVLPMLNVPTRR